MSGGTLLKRNCTVYTESVISELDNIGTDFSGAVSGLITAVIPAFSVAFKFKLLYCPFSHKSFIFVHYKRYKCSKH